MNKYRFFGPYAWSEPFEKEFSTDEEALKFRFNPSLVDGRWHASVWKCVNDQWLYWDDDCQAWASPMKEDDL